MSAFSADSRQAAGFRQRLYARAIVLQDDAGGRERYFCCGRSGRLPVDQGFDIVTRDIDTVFVPQKIFEQYLE